MLAQVMLWPNASAWNARIWMRVHNYPFTWMSVGSNSKQCTSPLETSPLLTPLGSELACYREVQREEEGLWAQKIDGEKSNKQEPRDNKHTT